MILLDTNVISELMRPRPEPAVLSWFKAQPRIDIWTSSVVIAELHSGIDLMPAGRGQKALRQEIEGMITENFQSQILNFDIEAAWHFGQILSTRQRIGQPIKEMDAEIAAIARVNGAILATRNTSDFLACDLIPVDPWADNSPNPREWQRVRRPFPPWPRLRPAR